MGDLSTDTGRLAEALRHCRPTSREVERTAVLTAWLLGLMNNSNLAARFRRAVTLLQQNKKSRRP